MALAKETRQSASNKPLYRVPSMAEIAEIPWNGYRVVSTFSGAGGSCLGFRMAGYRVVWASEFVPAAQETYRANHPDTILDTRDIRQVTAEDILSATGLAVGELDVFEGSPPCASFSTAGKRHEGWGQVRKYSDTRQRVDDLFFEYARLLRDLQPRVFVAENVSGLVKGVAKGYFKEILRALRDCGYVVEARLLDAQWLGVPQMRQRLIFQGVRKDLGCRPAWPEPLPYRYSVRDALPWITAVLHWNGVWKTSDEPCSTIVQSGARLLPTARFTGGTYVEAETDGSTHSYERRKFTIDELKRICAFPDDFILTGTYEQQWERLGRAVPPVMMYHVARVIRDEILGRLS